MLKRDVNKRPPLRPLRFANQCHVRLMRQPISLARVARDAGANHVFPRRQAAFVARQHVIEIQFAAIENVAAILAGVLVALEDVVPGKLHFLLRQTIEEQQHDDARHPNLPRNRRDHFVLVRRADGKIAPAVEIVRQEIVLRIGRNDLGVALIKRAKARRAEQMFTACQRRFNTRT